MTVQVTMPATIPPANLSIFRLPPSCGVKSSSGSSLKQRRRCYRARRRQANICAKDRPAGSGTKPSGVHLPGDEVLRHLMGAVGPRAGVGDPLLLAPLEAP